MSNFGQKAAIQGEKLLVIKLRKLTGEFGRHDIVRLDALAKALSVIATATWLGGRLAGWVAGWLGVRHTPVLYQNG